MNALLEVAISMALVYTLLSILVSYITEAWQRWKRTRGAVLRKSLETLLNDPFNKNFCELLYEHPLIRAQRKNDNHQPSYISTSLFVSAITDVLRREAVRPHIFMTTDGSTHVDEPVNRNPYEDIRLGIQSLAYSPLKVQLLSLMSETTDESSLLSRFGAWYDEYQQEVSSRFKSKARVKTMIISMLVAVIVNVDSISLVHELYRNKEMRAIVVEAAEQYVMTHSAPETPAAEDSTGTTTTVSAEEELRILRERIDEVETYLGSFGLPIGWTRDACGAQITVEPGVMGFVKEFAAILKCKFTSSSFDQMVLTIIGWVMTAIALSFGAPFWFDLLNKFVAMRSGRTRPQSQNPAT